jgi:WD40 repeat protein
MAAWDRLGSKSAGWLMAGVLLMNRSGVCFLAVGAAAALSVWTAASIAAAAAPPEKTPAELKALVTAAFPPDVKEFSAGSPELVEWGKQVEKALSADDFVTLENLAAESRSEAKPMPGAHWKIVMFHDMITYVSDKQPGAVERRVEACRRWFAAKPESIAARTALVRMQLQFAWEARGRGFVNTVTEDGAERFAERLEPVRKWVADADWTKVDDPYYFAGAIEYAKMAGGTAEQVDACMRAAAKCRQFVDEPFIAGAEFFLPRWHGSVDDLTEYALNVYEATRERCGAELYAAVVNRVHHYHGSTTFKDFPFSWSLVVAGYCDHAERKPNSLRLAGEFGILAWHQGDRAVGFALARHTMNNFNKYVFRSDHEYQNFVFWAFRPADQIGKTIFEVSGNIGDCVWDRDGRHVWYVDGRGINAVDTADGTIQALLPVSGASAIDRSSDGRYLAAGGSGPVVLVDLQVQKAEVLDENPDSRQLSDLRFLADGKTLAASTPGSTTIVTTWDIPEKKQATKTEIKFYTDLRDRTGFSPDGKLWVGHYAGSSIHPLFRILQPDVAPEKAVEPPAQPNGAAKPTPMVRYTGGRNPYLEKLNTTSLRLPPQAYPNTGSRMKRFAAFSPDSKYVAFSHETAIFLADLSSPTPFANLRIATTERSGFRCGAITADGKYVVAGLGRVVEEERFGKLQPTPLEAISPICVYRAADMSSAATLEGHQRGVRSVSISPDQTKIASSSEDGTIRIWEMPK